MLKFLVPALLSTTLLSGCRSMHAEMYSDESAAMYGGALMGDASSNSKDRAAKAGQMLIWTGSMTVEVMNISNAAAQITAKTKEMGGYLEGSGQDEYNTCPSSTLYLRIPSSQLAPLLASLNGVGDVTSKRLSSEDVTERYVDMQAVAETARPRRRGEGCPGH